MDIKSYLILNLHQTRYAIAAESISEIFLLPEITLVPEAPPDIVGMINLHGQFVPVMHLDLRFGRQGAQCQPSDSVIIVEAQDLKVGIIVHQVETVNDIDPRYIQHELTYGRELEINRAFVQGVINLDDEMILLLNVDNLIRHPEAFASLVASTEQDTETNLDTIAPDSFYEKFLANATPDTQEILRLRARNLRQESHAEANTDLISLAVVSIAGRYFGLDLAIVQEFTKIGRITSIPCCPHHIVGNMNLRGEILTLVDICQPLNLERSQQESPKKAVVVKVDEVVAGIVVEEVFDIVDLMPGALKPIPVAMNQDTASYFKGMTEYQDETLNVIDLPLLMAQGVMTVNLTA